MSVFLDRGDSPGGVSRSRRTIVKTSHTSCQTRPTCGEACAMGETTPNLWPKRAFTQLSPDWPRFGRHPPELGLNAAPKLVEATPRWVSQPTRCSSTSPRIRSVCSRNMFCFRERGPDRAGVRGKEPDRSAHRIGALAHIRSVLSEPSWRLAPSELLHPRAAGARSLGQVLRPHADPGRGQADAAGASDGHPMCEIRTSLARLPASHVGRAGGWGRVGGRLGEGWGGGWAGWGGARGWGRGAGERVGTPPSKVLQALCVHTCTRTY